MNSTSWVSSTLDSIFSTNGILWDALLTWSGYVAGVAGGVALIHFVHVIYSTAARGQVHKATVWYAARFCVGIGLLFGGIPFVVMVAKQADTLASDLWSTVTADVLAGKTLTLPPAPAAANVVVGLWDMAACISIESKTSGNSGAAAVSVNSTTLDTGDLLVSADGDPTAGGVPGQCGSIRFQVGDSGSLQASVANSEAAAISALTATMQSDAEAFADLALPPFSGGSVQLTSDAPGWVSSLQNSLQQAGQAAVTSDANSQAQYQAWQQSATALQWVGAGAWSMQIANRSGQVLEAASTTPVITGPQMSWWKDDVYQSQKAALLSADQSIRTALAVSGTASSQKMAYSAGQSDSIYRFLDLSRWQGFYTTLVGDSATANPIASIAATGHSLLMIGTGTIEAYLTAVGVSATASKVADVPVVGLVASGLSGGAAVIKALSPGIWMVVGGLMVAGASMAYVLPAIPFIYLLFFTLDWLRRVVMAAIMAPIWGLQHLSLDEAEGFGGKAVQGWLLLVDILLRPSFAILLLVASYSLFFAIYGLFTQTFYSAVRETLNGHMGGLSGLITYSIMSCALLAGLLKGSFWTLQHGPDWMSERLGLGGGGQSDSSHSEVIIAGAPGGVGQAASAGQAMLPSAGQDKGDQAEGGGSIRPAGTRSRNENEFLPEQ